MGKIKFTETCAICGKIMDTGAVKDKNCGGDCFECMAKAGDPDAIESINKSIILAAAPDMYLAIRAALDSWGIDTHATFCEKMDALRKSLPEGLEE